MVGSRARTVAPLPPVGREGSFGSGRSAVARGAKLAITAGKLANPAGNWPLRKLADPVSKLAITQTGHYRPIRVRDWPIRAETGHYGNRSIRIEPMRVGLVRIEPIRIEPTRIEPIGTEPMRIEPIGD